MLRVSLLGTIILPPTSAEPADWTVVDSANAVPGVADDAILHSSKKTVDDCRNECDADADCKMWTFNHHVSPYHCFWYIGSSPKWAPLSNSHTTSGCLSTGEKAADSCPQPLPPAPPAPMPEWVGPVPDYTVNASAGMRVVDGVEHFTVYNATKDGAPNPFGLYNHGPMVTHFNGTYLMSWYNAPKDETTYKRSVAAYSADGKTWSEPFELFPNYTHDGEENGPWTTLNGRLYTQSGTQDAGHHIETIISVMRRVHVSGPNAQPVLGPVFWLNRTVPENFSHLGFPTYLEMDADTRADAEQYLASVVRTLTAYPDFTEGTGKVSAGKMAYNERSVYMVPGTRTLVDLIRGGGPKTLYASSCELPVVPALPAEDAYQQTLFSCRAGVGDRFLAMVEVATDYSNFSDPRTCNWTTPVSSNIPDTHSRTCAAPLPGGQGVYLVGNQNPKHRDPVTLAVSADGLIWDQHWAVRYDAPAVRYPGHAKCVGFQYPGAMIFGNQMFVSYSVGKEDIALSIFPLSSVLPKHAGSIFV